MLVRREIRRKERKESSPFRTTRSPHRTSLGGTAVTSSEAVARIIARSCGARRAAQAETASSIKVPVCPSADRRIIAIVR